MLRARRRFRALADPDAQRDDAVIAADPASGDRLAAGPRPLARAQPPGPRLEGAREGVPRKGPPKGCQTPRQTVGGRWLRKSAIGQRFRALSTLRIKVNIEKGDEP